MRDGWHSLVDEASLRVEGGVPVEVMLGELYAFGPIDERGLLDAVEHYAGLWLVWEDQWRGRDVRRRPVDLASKQPSHRVRWRADDADEVAWLLVVDANARWGDTLAWRKDEWYSSCHEQGGGWRRDAGGWTLEGRRTPGGAPGVLVVGPLGPRPVCTRRSR